ncbi:MAG TPA: hypothetical protein VMZ66_07115 [Aeromicrobium sp.]|nr:hypothetical protein [Aeromicrobium sp.]
MRVALALLLTFAALCGCGSPPENAGDCRKQFAAESHVLGKHGNPGSKDFTPKLTARWDRLSDGFERLSTSATAKDCPQKLTAMKRQTKRVESVLHKLDDYDVARMTRDAEGDLKRAQERRGPGAGPDYVLITTFRALQEASAEAQKALAPYVASVDAIDPDKYSKLAAAMVALYNAAASNAAFADFKDARDTIKNYEPPE